MFFLLRCNLILYTNMALFAVFDAANICNSFLICVVLFLKNRENVQEMYF